MRGSVFSSRVNFDNRFFTGTTNFRGATFRTVPHFYGCNLHQETFFPGFENFIDTSSEDAFQAYRVLKLTMENLRNRVDEGSFFALEQRSLRKSMPWRERYISFSFLSQTHSIALETTIQQIVRPFSIWNVRESAVLATKFPNANTLAIKIFAVLQSLTSFIFISLFVFLKVSSFS